MQRHIPGYPRIGSNRELKKACEQYCSGKISAEELVKSGKNTHLQNWQLQKEKDIDLIPSNDFSSYDQVLDLSFSMGAIPEPYHDVICKKPNSGLVFHFAMKRGYQHNGIDISKESSIKHISIKE